MCLVCLFENVCRVWLTVHKGMYQKVQKKIRAKSGNFHVDASLQSYDLFVASNFVAVVETATDMQLVKQP